MSHGFSRIFTDKFLLSGLDYAAMDTSQVSLKHSALTEKIIGVFYDVYNELGYGFLESTYAEAMVVALRQSGLTAIREVSVPVWFRGVRVGQYFGDVLVDGTVLIELKATRALDSAHEAQILHYLRATEIEVGLLLNFGVRPQFRRLLFDNERKKNRANPCESVAEVSA
jgi:GxxExxY protein